MAGGQERILRRRIRSVQSTRKITKAMELIAASRIVRAQNRIAANRPFREGMERVLRLTAAADSAGGGQAAGHARVAAPRRHPGHRRRPRPGRLLQLGRAARHRAPGGRATGRTASRSRCGRSARRRPSYFRYRGIEPAESFVGFADRPEFSDARHVAAVVAAPFVAGEIDLVEMVSTRFISAGTQRVERMQMLPLPLPETDEEAGEPEEHRSRATPSSSPSPRSCSSSWRRGRSRRRSSPRCSRGRPSFFTAQQRAMAAATENADELVRTLTRVMNRARQDAITTEIMEIVGGAEALRQAKGA